MFGGCHVDVKCFNCTASFHVIRNQMRRGEEGGAVNRVHDALKLVDSDYSCYETTKHTKNSLCFMGVFLWDYLHTRKLNRGHPDLEMTNEQYFLYFRDGDLVLKLLHLLMLWITTL